MKAAEFSTSAATSRPADESRLLLIPSWIVSLAVHAGLLVVLATMLRSCDGSVLGTTEGTYRNVGIYEKPSNSTKKVDNPLDDERQTDNKAQAAVAALPNAVQQPEFAPVDIPKLSELPSLPKLPAIGSGTASSGSQLPNRSDFDHILDSSRTSRAPNTGGNRSAAVPFFGIQEHATRVVYVVDCSGSMANHGAMRVAKDEVKTSLANLDATHQFQVMFYNSNVTAMSSDRDKRLQTFWATEINRTLARQFIDSIQPDGGTSHVPALRKALSLNPDVVFFLTDADEPRMTAADLEEVRKANRSGARIHCVEFGRGSSLAIDNFLKRLARDNGGSYVYRDVTRFGQH